MPKELTDSRQKIYSIPIRKIIANTNPRQALHPSLDSQGWTVFDGDKAVWPLATSDDPEDRAKFVQLIKDFDPDIAAMAATMLTQGQLQPVEVREGGSTKGDHKYTLSFGCRRCLAILFNWCLTGRPKEPMVNAVMLKGNELVMLQRGLVENIRKVQNPIEEARTMKAMLNNDGGLTKEALATELGMTVATVNNRLKLLELDAKTQKKILSGDVKATKALAAERNGKKGDDDTPPKAKLRSRKEIEAACEEFIAGTPQRKVLDWMLGKSEKIS